MKSKFWVICGVALLCIGIVRCNSYFSNDGENSLDIKHFREAEIPKENKDETTVCNPVCGNGKTCETNSKNEPECLCPKGFEGENCETLTKDQCEKEKKMCADTGGTCYLDENAIKCKCPADIPYAEETGCTVTEDLCNQSQKECIETGGSCSSTVDGIICDCKEGQEYVKDKGCEEADFCKEVCGDKPGVDCKGDKAKKDTITCSCDDDEKAYDKSDKSCKDDNCQTECGISYNKPNDDLKCVNGPFGKVECKCKDSKKGFDTSDKECKIDYCKEICQSLTCIAKNKFEEDEVQCKCSNSDAVFDKEEKKCKINYCRKVCGTDERVSCSGDDYDKEKKTTDCTCENGYEFLSKRCKKTCSDDNDCKNEGKCVDKKLAYKLCKCDDATTGDTCETITKCETDYKNCKGERGDCVFEKGAVKCKCPDGKELYKKGGYCEAKCTKDEDCTGSNRKCTDGYCLCQAGYEGDDCKTVSGCKELEAKCKEIDTECIFSIVSKDAPNMATCKCKEGDKYDPKENKCKNSYCYPDNPCTDGECTADESTGIGYCKCSESKYYNYKAGKCEDLPDKCILMKSSCKEHEKCVKGKCECKYQKKKDDECKPIFCKPNLCFTYGVCALEDGSCSCEEGKYYYGKSCKDAKCSLKEFKKNCTCPEKMSRKEGSEDCEPDEDKKCSKECGHGICVIKNKKETCSCFNNFATLSDGKCIVKKTMCAGEKLQEDKMKCDCTGQYKQAEDGITCSLKTCKDDDVKEECALKGGQCKMNWMADGYTCECPIGYDKDENGKCADPCSIEKNIKECAIDDKFCYNSVSKLNPKTFNCDCPPTIQKNDSKCSEKAENTYLMKNIPVLKKRYEINSGINKVLLSADLIKSMEQTFSSDLFEYGYIYDYKITGDIIDCSVWINFKKTPDKTELNKIKLLPRTFKKVCDDCDESAIVWPPNLLLGEEGLKKAEPVQLKFCSNEVSDLLCGKGAECKDDQKCTCGEGYKLIEYSIRQVGGYDIQRCEDIDECATGSHNCPGNTKCVNNFGSYKCACKDGFKKPKTPEDPENDKSDCYDMCTPSPCKKGKCSLNGNGFNCECDPGIGGSLCDRADANYASAKKGTVVVGAVLGTILAVGAIAVLYYIIKNKKKSGSEDFVPTPRLDHAEMAERRPMRGISNQAYE